MIRMVLMSVTVTVPILAFTLIYKDWYDGGDVGIILVYNLSIETLAYYIFWSLNKFQNRFLAYERIIQFTNIP